MLVWALEKQTPRQDFVCKRFIGKDKRGGKLR
jgi:hypothetical protein